MEPHLFGSVYRHPTTLGVHNLDPHLRSIGKWDRLLKPPSMSKFQCSDSALTPFQTACESWIAAHCAPEFPGLQKSLSNTLSWIDWIWFVQKWWIYLVTRWFMIMIFLFIFRGKIIVILWNWYPMFRHSMALLARFCTRNPWRGWTWCCPQITPSWQGGLRTGKKQSGSKRNPGKR